MALLKSFHEIGKRWCFRSLLDADLTLGKLLAFSGLDLLGLFLRGNFARNTFANEDLCVHFKRCHWMG
jgi:hypothetical protein